MADFAMCKNDDCGYVDFCWRYNAPPNIPNQWFGNFGPKIDASVPLGEVGECDFFMPFPDM
jgi:hypothetical protein